MPHGFRKHNDAYVSRHIESEKSYLDNLLEACDPAISLDREQREVVLSEEDHTFHSIGYTILRQSEEERKKIVEGGYMYTVINNYLKSSVLRNPEVVDKLILFFGSYFTAPYESETIHCRNQEIR